MKYDLFIKSIRNSVDSGHKGILQHQRHQRAPRFVGQLDTTYPIDSGHKRRLQHQMHNDSKAKN